MKRNPNSTFIISFILVIFLFFCSCQKDSDLLAEIVLNKSGSLSVDEEDSEVEESTIILNAIDDAYLQDGKGYNENTVRVEANTRTTYLKFDLSSIEGTITGAYLEFTTDSDEGYGHLEAFEGLGNDWTEEDLTFENAPEKGELLGEIDSEYEVGRSQKVILESEGLTPSIMSIVLNIKSGDDISIASKESTDNPGPKLVVEYIGKINGDSQQSNDNEDENKDDSISIDNVITLNTLKAFPSAIGAGAFARVNPKAAKFYEVTNLNTSGPGSFREAFEASGSRIVIIKVEGRVEDSNAYAEYDTSSGDIAVWGQMAPGLGLTVSHPRMTFTRAGNLIFRFLTLQSDLGKPCTVNVDCFDALNYLQIENETSNYVDHCSLRYGLDQTWTLNINTHSQGGNASLNRSSFVYNLLAEADPDHSTASIMNKQGDTPATTDIGDHTWSRNMTYNISHRFPNLNANGDFENYNNFIVNWSARLSRYNITPNVDYHRNYNKQGNVTRGLSGMHRRGNKLNYGGDWNGDEPRIYSAFNITEGINVDNSSNLQSDLYTWFKSSSNSLHGVSIKENGPVPTQFFTTTQQFSFNPPPEGYWDAMDVPRKVMASVGHNRGINKDGTPYYGSDDLDNSYFSKTKNNGTESSYRSIGSWTQSSFPGTSIYTDTDGDYMPDWFENQHTHLNPNNPNDMLMAHVDWSFSEGYAVTNNAGYTNLEICAEYYAGGFETMIDGTNNLNIND
ncbi:hypothetical protein GGR42_000751 [Saonia flava]|uniref:Carbohydrate-binding module family 96 domain-containing protein n=1 Tax=Saonia flava TaxID=523696 RepID=A0A846R092_9FLAO|nr:hypothetical protein [Saonia flava]NJB70289.1 hypothetical protein [Saonia flava]